MPHVTQPPASFQLNTGASIPSVGLGASLLASSRRRRRRASSKLTLLPAGTWQAKPGEVASAVEHALKSGYRHLDCALIYQNEQEVGAGIKASSVPRSEIFITSKL